MKKFKAFLILSLCCSAAFSQKAYFVYLQSEGTQPFFLKMKEQLYSSNATGYLILSRLQDSTYTFSVGFPQNKWPEQIFSLPIDGRDKGFLLKNTEGRDWVLSDLQTLQTIKGQSASATSSVKTEPREVSRFTDALSKATNDPSLKLRVVPQTAVAKVEEKPVPSTPVKQEVAVSLPPVQEKKEEIITPASDTIVQPVLAAAVPVALPEKKQEVVRSVTDSVVQPPVAALGATEEKKALPVEEKKQEVLPIKEATPDTVALATSATDKLIVEQKEELVTQAVLAYKPSVVTRKTESSTSEGFGITYIDAYPDGKKDTVQIFIPNPKTINRQVPPPQEEARFLPMDTDTKDLTPVKKAGADAKNDCSSTASETDFLKLRKKMVATEGDDEMLAAAKKTFKTKCFTTEQVKNLGTLFLNDAGRYNFFDAAYLAVADKENFAGLQAELKDAYYISRFKAMLR